MKTIHIRDSKEDLIIGKIVCVGRNYADHASELGNKVPDKPILFLKPPSSVIYSGDKIQTPSFTNNMQHEVELVLAIGKEIKNADGLQADDAITAYGVGLDMTLRDVQNELKKNGHPWTVAKCFDTSTVLSPFESRQLYKLTLKETISLSVNDVVKQSAKLNTMIFFPIKLVQYISSVMKLEPGDLVFTGTPAGVGKVSKGDKIHASISGIAELDCEVE
jgi:5-carboxymethyl-2-hydroxymuconate isomerase